MSNPITWGTLVGSAWLNALTSNAPAYSVLELYIYTTQCQATLDVHGCAQFPSAGPFLAWVHTPAFASMRVASVFAGKRPDLDAAADRIVPTWECVL